MLRILPIIIALLLASTSVREAQGQVDSNTNYLGFTVEKAQTFFTDELGDPLTSVFLNEIFGPLFPSADSDVSHKSVFSSIIGYFNIIAIGLGGLLFTWNATVGLLQTAHEGELLGRRWSSLWAPMRIVFAVVMLIPLPNLHGYNAIQGGVAYLVRGATMTASFVWKTAAESLLEDQVPIAAAPPRVQPDAVTQLYGIAACRYIVDSQLSELNRGGSTIISDHSIDIEIPEWLKDQNASLVNAGRAIESYQRRQGVVLDLGNGRQVAICGYWETPPITKNITTYMENTGLKANEKQRVVDMYREGHLANMKRLYQDMEVIVNKKGAVILSENRGEQSPPNSSRAIAETLKKYNSFAASQTRILLREIESMSGSKVNRHKLLLDTVSGGECLDRDFKAGAGLVKCYGEGWIGAGKWYVSIARINSHLASLTSATGEAVMAGFFSREEKATWLGDVSRAIGDFTRGTLFRSDAGDYLDRDSARTAWAGFAKSFANDVDRLPMFGFNIDPNRLNLSGMDGTEDGEEFSWRRLFTDVFDLGLEDVIVGLSIITQGEDPLIELMWWGDTILTAVSGIMVALFVVPGSAVALPAVGTLWAAGALLQLILPMMPWILWVVAVTGYFLLIVEAVVGASLWAFAHLRMDGEGISGDARNGWTLILALVLTPILMVFGFIVGMMIFRVTSSLLLSGIFPAAHAALATASAGTVLLALPAVALIVAVMQLILIERSFSLVTEFPSRVLNWIGGKADLADQGALDRARIGMIGAMGAMPGVARGVGGAGQFAISQGRRGLSAALPDGRVRGGGKDEPTSSR